MPRLLFLLALMLAAPAWAVDCPTPATAPAPPVYPAALQKAGIGGTVKLRVTVDACGRVANIEVGSSSGHPELDAAAMAAAKNWQFQPNIGTVMVPVEFRIDEDETRLHEEPDAGLPVAPAPAPEPVPAYIANSKLPPTGKRYGPQERVPGYVPDSRPLGFASVAEAKAYMLAPCDASAKVRGCSVETVREQPLVVMVSDSCDVSFWGFADAGSGMGPSIIRDRFYFTSDGGSHLRTSTLCEGGKKECKALQDFLAQRQDQPRPGPPVPPPPPNGPMCGQSGG